MSNGPLRIEQYETVRYDLNCNPLGVPDSVTRAIMENISAVGRYPDTYYEPLRNAIASYACCAPEHLVLGSGSSDLLRLFVALLAPKKALLPIPSATDYEHVLSVYGCETDFYELDINQDYHLDMDDFIAHLSDTYDIVILGNPNNPTSQLISKADIEKLAKAQGKSVETIKNIIASLHEFNPMMGHRGCRLAVTYPEIAKMQTKAVIRAAINVQKKHSDWTVKPEIMIPLVCEVKELKYVKKVVVETADAEIAAAGVKLEYEVGTMIEIPRAALTADEIATEADFFCFGTNDLTQMTFGFSRDDAGKFLNAYYDTKIFENDPFAKLDQNGVGKLMDMAIKLGKPVNPKLHVGICGEHGGDPSSVEFCHKIGLDYVSCSPFRVPIARLAAAQAAISNK